MNCRRRSQDRGDKKADALDRVFDMAYSLLDDETMKHGGVDVEALDASLASIRSQYLALVDGREQIIAKKDALLRRRKGRKSKAGSRTPEQD